MWRHNGPLWPARAEPPKRRKPKPPVWLAQVEPLNATPRPAERLFHCPDCRGRWFTTDVAIHDGEVVGYALPLTCRSCGATIRHLPGESAVSGP